MYLNKRAFAKNFELMIQNETSFSPIKISYDNVGEEGISQKDYNPTLRLCQTFF